MKIHNQTVLSITGVMMKDQKSNGYTAYFAEFPEVVAQGENFDDAKINLVDAFKSMIAFKSVEAQEEINEDDSIITENYPLSFT